MSGLKRNRRSATIAVRGQINASGCCSVMLAFIWTYFVLVVVERVLMSMSHSHHAHRNTQLLSPPTLLSSTDDSSRLAAYILPDHTSGRCGPIYWLEQLQRMEIKILPPAAKRKKRKFLTNIDVCREN